MEHKWHAELKQVFFFLTAEKKKSRWPGVMQLSDVWQQARKGHADIISHRRRSSSIHSVDKSLLASRVTYTLSRSMSWLCRSLPSVVKRSLKSLIWSASSGFRLNSAGNSEIQYLAGIKQRGGEKERRGGGNTAQSHSLSRSTTHILWFSCFLPLSQNWDSMISKGIKV